MIYDEDPFRRRPRKSTARRKQQEKCVWMAENPGNWPSKRGAISKIMPSDGCKGDTAPLALGLWYDFHEFGWHLGNVGSVELGLEPDLMTMGKAIESGMPVTAVLGTPEAFNVVESGKVVWYGPYQGNPVVTEAASATLEFLRKQNFEDLFDYGFQLQKMMGDCFSRQGVAISISGHPTIYSLWFSERAPQSYTEALSLIRHDVSRFVYEELGRQGVVTLPSPWGRFFFTFAHDEPDFEVSAAAFESAAKQLSRSNLLKRN